MMKLSDMQSGSKGTITAISGDIAFQRRITAVGMTPGSHFEIIQNTKGCPILLYMRSTMLAVNSADCAKIEAEELS